MTTTPELSPPEGVPPKVWEQIAERAGGRWAIKERNASGEVVGTSYRYQNARKGFQTGGERGLIYSEPLNDYAGSSVHDPVFVCEGASDTASLLSLGFDAVGIPMAGHSGEILAELLKGRHIVVIRDADKAGKTGTDKIILATKLNCDSVRAIAPPSMPRMPARLC